MFIYVIYGYGGVCGPFMAIGRGGGGDLGGVVLGVYIRRRARMIGMSCRSRTPRYLLFFYVHQAISKCV